MDAPTANEPIDPDLAMHLEEASLNAWPALNQLLHDGWLLRFTRGFTKRANSVNPLRLSTVDLDAKIDYCEAAYARYKLPCIFRLNSILEGDPLDERLQQRGYETLDHSHVLVRSTNSLPPLPARCQVLERTDWLNHQHRMTRMPKEAAPLHALLLDSNPLERGFFARTASDGTPIACALGVLDGPALGVFDVITDQSARRAGHARALMIALLHWAADRHARHVWLQVQDTNHGAVSMYKKLGFVPAYRYWYRQRAATSTTGLVD